MDVGNGLGRLFSNVGGMDVAPYKVFECEILSEVWTNNKLRNSSFKTQTHTESLPVHS